MLAKLLPTRRILHSVIVGTHTNSSCQPADENSAVFENNISALGEVLGLGEFVSFS